MLKKLAPYNKTVVVALAVVLTGLNGLYGNNSTVQFVISLAAALGVYQVPNGKKA